MKFKVGQRVKIVSDKPYFKSLGVVNRVGTIRNITPDPNNTVFKYGKFAIMVQLTKTTGTMATELDIAPTK
jgi:hypothetical protein